MARYNHFALEIYEQIPFTSVPIGEKFRMDRFKGKRRRKDIIMVKTGELSYQEQRSKVATNLFHGDFYVSSFSKKNRTILKATTN